MKNHFLLDSLKFLPQKMHFQNCFLKKHLPDSYSLSDSSSEEKLLKLSLICLITFFQCVYTLHLCIMIVIFLESRIQAKYC